MRRWFVVGMVVAFAAGCSRESDHGDPPAGGWENGATKSQSFFGNATVQFKFEDLTTTPRDATTTDTILTEDVGGPLIWDNL